MSTLQVVIFRDTKVARFSGSGTYQAKEAIKQLGQARFLGSEKIWEVRGFALSTFELESLFPGISVLEENGGGEPSPAAPTRAPEAVRSPESPNPAPASGLPAGISVSQFLERVRLLLRSGFPQTFFVYGVLSDVTQSGNRVFMELKESAQSDERVKCVIWQNPAQLCAGLEKAGFKLEAELQVMFEVNAGLHKRGGQITLSVERIVVEYTIGKVAALREQTNERLKKENLFAKNKSLALPFLPRRLGILTSSGGTVINDFMASLDVAQFGFELFWYNVSVQGADAKQSIVRGIDVLSRYPNLDAILIFRGGGSQSELAVFNDYEVARAVCLSPLPVVSAVGHQEDQSSVQDVSYRALGVPKDIGRYFADIIIDFRQRFEKAIGFTATMAGQKLLQAEGSVELYTKSILKFMKQLVLMHFDSVRRLVDGLPPLARSVLGARRQRAVDLTARLGAELKRLIEQKEIRVQGYEELFSALGPEAQLKRGFAIVRTADGSGFVTAGEKLKLGDDVLIEFSDRKKTATITGDG